MLFRRVSCLAIWLLVVVCTSAGAANLPPESIGTASIRTLRAGGSAAELALAPLFRDPDPAGPAVRIQVRLGTTYKNIDVVLFDQQAPLTVANFLRYIRNGKYQGSFIHRLAKNFVVQGGGFRWNEAGQIAAIETYANVMNEPGVSNVRGTIAMAKLGSDPNSATSQWFINQNNNAANLDFQNGGFTAFGRVVGNGMQVVDEINALPAYSLGSSVFSEVPLKDVVGGSLQRVFTVETAVSEIGPLLFSATSSRPDLVAATVVDGKLRLIPANVGGGTALVTLTVADVEGASIQATYNVTVQSKSAEWSLEEGSPTADSTLVYRTEGGDGLPNDMVPLNFPQAAVGQTFTRSVTLVNNSEETLSNLTVELAGANAAAFEVSPAPGAHSLASGASLSFTVAFNPQSTALHRATLRVRTGNAEASSLLVDLQGSGAAEVKPFTGVTPQRFTIEPRVPLTVPDYRGTSVVIAPNFVLQDFTQTPAPGTLLGPGSYNLVFSAKTKFGQTLQEATSLEVGYGRVSTQQTRVTDAYAGASIPANAAASLPANSVLSAFGTPAVDDAYNVAARVTIQAGRALQGAIYREDATGERQLVAWQNGPSGLGTLTFKSFGDPVLSPFGKIAFPAKVNGAKAVADDALWTDAFGPLQPVLREGTAVPGLGTATLKLIVSAAVEENAVLALVKLNPLRGLVTAGVDDTALVRLTSPTSGTLLARVGKPFAGLTIKKLSVLQPAAGSPGQGRWQAGADLVASFTLQGGRVVLVKIDAHGTATALAETAREMPQLAASIATFGLPSVGGSGLAVAAWKAKKPGVTAQNDQTLLVKEDGQDFAAVVTEGTSAGVTGGAVFASFGDPVMNDQGDLLFQATLRGGKGAGANNGGLWLNTGVDANTLVARLGAPAADKSGNPIPNATWSAFRSFALPDGEGAGAVFVAQLAGRGVTPQSNVGLWVADASGTPRLLLRTKDQLTLPNGTKTVASFTLLNSLAGSYGVRRSYSTNGSLAVQVVFTDRTQALVRLDVP